jgi:hypothetical protein
MPCILGGRGGVGAEEMMQWDTSAHDWLDAES